MPIRKFDVGGNGRVYPWFTGSLGTARCSPANRSLHGVLGGLQASLTVGACSQRAGYEVKEGKGQGVVTGLTR